MKRKIALFAAFGLFAAFFFAACASGTTHDDPPPLSGSALSWGGPGGNSAFRDAQRAPLTAEVILDGNEIVAVTIILGSGETVPRMDIVQEAANALVGRTSVQLDAVTGNTVTWNAAQAALNRAVGIPDTQFVSPVTSGGPEAISQGINARAHIAGISAENGGPFIYVFPEERTGTGSALSWGGPGNNAAFRDAQRAPLTATVTVNNGLITAAAVTLGIGETVPRMDIIHPAVAALVGRRSVQLDAVTGNTVTWNAAQAALNRAVGIPDAMFVSPVTSGGPETIRQGINARAHIAGISAENGGPFIYVFPTP